MGEGLEFQDRAPEAWRLRVWGVTSGSGGGRAAEGMRRVRKVAGVRPGRAAEAGNLGFDLKVLGRHS